MRAQGPVFYSRPWTERKTALVAAYCIVYVFCNPALPDATGRAARPIMRALETKIKEENERG